MIAERQTDNKATIFLLPAVLYKFNLKHKDLLKAGFINLFLEDINSENTYKGKDCVFLLFKSNNQEELRQLISKVEEEIRDEYDYSGGYTVLVVDFPPKFIHNYYCFLRGEYSKFTKEYQDLFPQEPSLLERGAGLKETFTKMVFKKSAKLRSAIEKELYTELPEDSEVCRIHNNNEILDMTKMFRDDDK